jgi:GNAT superfamily N-acetyltransferase
MTVTLRRVEKKKHALALANLTLELARYEKLEPPTPAALKRLMKDARKGEKIRAVLAEIDGEYVGYSVSFETYSTFQGRSVFYLEDIFVLPEHRRKGVGAKLFLDCTKRAKKRQCCRMEWQVLAWNEPALRFYEKLRAEKLTDWVWHRLGEDRFP